MTETALLTDRYELTMLSSFLADGSANRQSVFEAFARKLPTGRRYGVVAGTGRLLEALKDFHFEAEDIDWLVEVGAITDQCATYLRDFDLTGVTIEGYREGDLYFPGSPILTVSGPLGKCVILETLILSIYNYDCAIASAGARMVFAAEGRPLTEMGSRRTHEQAAIASARVAFLVGFAATSNLAAGKRYGIPTKGTAAHAFTLAHQIGEDDSAKERTAFASQVKAHGTGTSLLVDTYDTAQGIRNAIEVAGPELGAIRIDSGDDLGEEARKARTLLDELGAPSVGITVTSDLDEYVLADLVSAPITGYGVGTKLVTGSGHPAAGMVYKLVAVATDDDEFKPLVPVAKKASGKASLGGKKVAFRTLDSNGHILKERIVLRAFDDGTETFSGRRLQVTFIEDGKVVFEPTLAESRAFHAKVRQEIAPGDRSVANSERPITAATL